MFSMLFTRSKRGTATIYYHSSPGGRAIYPSYLKKIEIRDIIHSGIELCPTVSVVAARQRNL